jgi:hypothetical protein
MTMTSVAPAPIHQRMGPLDITFALLAAPIWGVVWGLALVVRLLGLAAILFGFAIVSFPVWACYGRGPRRRRADRCA